MKSITVELRKPMIRAREKLGASDLLSMIGRLTNMGAILLKSRSGVTATLLSVSLRINVHGDGGAFKPTSRL
jgi:hypothetical protein